MRTKAPRTERGRLHARLRLLDARRSHAADSAAAFARFDTVKRSPVGGPPGHDRTRDGS